MKRFPFPAELVRISADGAQAHMDRRNPAGSYSREGSAAYRMPDGKVHLAYDPYAPEYERGGEPGLATGHHDLRHYPNETSGYTSRATNFLSASDLRLGGMKIDETCVGIMALDGVNTLVVAQDPAEMMKMEARILDAGGSLHLGTIDTRSLPRDADLQVFAAARAIGGFEIFGAPDLDTLADITRKRYFFIDPGETSEAFFKNLDAHAADKGWQVCIGDRDNSMPDVEKILAARDMSPEF